MSNIQKKLLKKNIYGCALVVLICVLLLGLHILKDNQFSFGKMEKLVRFETFSTQSPAVLPKKDNWLAKRQELLSQKGNNKKVMLFCYMRGGSTFFSELFRQNKEVMYWYEPYDAFYSSVFGEKTWHKPQDIFWYQHSPGNSTLREQPHWELNEAAKFNHNLLTCNFSALPVELFYHKGVRSSNLGSFRRCIQSDSEKDLSTCRHKYIPQCSGNSQQVFHNRCPEYIKLSNAKMHSNETGSEGIPDSFMSFAECNKQFEKPRALCTHHLEDKCQSSRIVTYKGLRVTMRAVESMLKMDPDLHVIYYTRDPRGTVTSRVNIPNTYRDSQKNPVLEAKYLCAKMRADLDVYNRLKIEYPGSILWVKYENVATNRYEEVKRIYSFYGMRVHQRVFNWMRRNEMATSNGGSQSTTRKNSSASLERWRSSFTVDARQKMTEHCKDVLLALNYTL